MPVAQVASVGCGRYSWVSEQKGRWRGREKGRWRGSVMSSSIVNDSSAEASAAAVPANNMDSSPEDLDVFVKELMDNSKFHLCHSFHIILFH